MTPEELERVKEFMRGRGMTEEQIEERIKRAKERAQNGEGGDRRPGGGPGAESGR